MMKVKQLYILSLLLSSLPVFAQDSVIVSASKQYSHPGLLQVIFMGKNYRDTWELPVKMPVFNIHTVKGGLSIKELGGGQQTKSLRLIDKDSVEWALRTVEKDVEGALPKLLRNTIAEKTTQDMVSASHPYASITVGELARALELHAPMPEVYFIPDDPAFGEYRQLFAHAVCMLERSNPSINNDPSFSTEEFMVELGKKPAAKVDSRMLLKARLLDMLIADWDRHLDQWKWGMVKRNGKEVFYPIPRDRDQAFFYSDGFLVKFVRLFAMKHLAGFTHTNRQLNNLNRKAWQFDRLLMNDLTEADWITIITNFQSTLNDAQLQKAVAKLPKEVYDKDGAVILSKLISRRNDMMEYGLKYYRFLVQNAEVIGTNKEDRVRVSSNRDSVVLSIHSKDTEQLIFKRSYHPDQTRTIKLSLLDGNDEMIIDENIKSRIRFLLNGGQGQDSFKMNSDLRITADKETKSEMKNKPG